MAGESQMVPNNVPDPTVLTTEALVRAVGSERDWAVGQFDVLRERLRGMDEATKVLHATVTRVPTDVQQAVGHLRELHGERFRSVETQFAERDIRTQQASEASAQALAAALQAAKELVSSEGEAAAAANVKSETSFAKQVDQISTLIQTNNLAIDARITELKERIDRGEGADHGAQDSRTDSRLTLGAVLGVVSVLLVLVFGVISVIATMGGSP